jgi:quercetin dioxygenase-like cupin family protein
MFYEHGSCSVPPTARLGLWRKADAVIRNIKAGLVRFDASLVQDRYRGAGMQSSTAEPWAKTHVIRFDELSALRSGPPDVLLPRYQRERFSVIGRANERQPDEPGVAVNANVNFGYIRCEPGTGNCSHKHPNWEIFIPMSGLWRLTIEGGPLEQRGELLLEPWDVIILPGDTFHEATNVSESVACLLSLNPGSKGASYALHPTVIDELRMFSPEAARAVERTIDVHP